MINKSQLTIQILFLLFLMACGPRAENFSKTRQLTVAIEEYPGLLDPRLAIGAYNAKVSKLIFNGLLKYDHQLKLVPDVAKSVSFVSPTLLNIELKPDIKFSDGTLLSALDVKVSYESIVAAKLKSPLASDFLRIKKIEVISPLKLTIELKASYAPFLAALTTGMVRLKDQQIYGTGPYVLTQQVQDQYLLLQANPHYFGEPPKLAQLKIIAIKDDISRVLALIKGDVDLIQNATPYTWIPWLMQHYGLQLLRGDSINYQYLGFNLKDPLLAKQQVRWAIAYLLDIESLIAFRFKNYAKPATSILQPMHWAFNPKLTSFSHDPEKAMHLLDEAGLVDPDGVGPKLRFKLIFKTSTNPSSVDLALAIKEQLKAGGIEVDIRSYDWGIFYKDIRSGNFQMYSLEWVGVAEPDLYRNIFHTDNFPPKGANRGFYSNKEVDQLTLAASVSLNEAERIKYYQRVQQIVADELPYISLWYRDNFVLMQKDLQGYYLTPNASFEGLASVYRK